MQRGVGLGLAIAKRVVENHGGSIALSSKVSEGTVVTVSLPQQAGPAGD
jgi:signal transduction histidine kinase